MERVVIAGKKSLALLVAGLACSLAAEVRAAYYVESFDAPSDPAAISSVGWSFISDTQNPSVVSVNFAIDNDENVVKITSVNDISSMFNSGHVYIEHDLKTGESPVDGPLFGQHRGDLLLYTDEPLTQNGASAINLNGAEFSVDYQNGNGTTAGHPFFFAFRLSNGTWYLLDDVIIPTDSNVHVAHSDPIDVSNMTFRYLYPPPGLIPTAASYSLTAAQLQTVTAVGIYVWLGGELLPSRFDNFKLTNFGTIPGSGPSATVPEPSTAVGLLVAAFGAICLRGRRGLRRK
jgi:hypothetical protein